MVVLNGQDLKEGKKMKIKGMKTQKEDELKREWDPYHDRYKSLP